MLSRRADRLARCFQLIALAVGAPALAVHCGSSDHAAGSPSPDAASENDATASAEDVTAQPMPDAATSSADGGAALADAQADADAPVACFATVSIVDAAGPDGEELCDFAIPCGLEPAGLVAVGCVVLVALPDGAPFDAEGSGFPYCTLNEGMGCSDGGYAPVEAGVAFECIGCPGGGGRRPAGLVAGAPVRAATEVGAYFAEMARLEAASVRAFRELAAELAAHGAPPSLVDAARESARDEVRHAHAMAGLARRFGAEVRAPDVRPVARRSLAALARDNAVEGCVRETFGALVNAWQGAHAGDPEVRAVMRAIAADELRHAALSWEIAAWASRRVGPGSRRAVARARRRAVGRLVARASTGVSRTVQALAGLPDAAGSEALARELAERLWI